MTLKPGRPVKLLDPEMSGAVLSHPTQRALVIRIAELISWLRQCEEPQDFYEFQRYLFGDLYIVEERRAQCSRMVKRLKRGLTLPSNAPPAPHSGDPTKLESWELEAYVFERLARQLRTVGDGLAWRCFSYDRRMILTLSRNDPAGPMYGKSGLPYELGRVKELWEQDHNFALIHDLTNCLRIGDLTQFTDNGRTLLREIKATPHTDAKQMARIQAAVDAIMHGSPLPGPSKDARLVELAEPYLTDLKQTNDLLQLAKKHGSRGMKLPQGRAVVATSMLTVFQRFGSDYKAGARALDSIRQRAIKRAGIADALHHIKAVSGDTASRSPIMAPWSIYPFTPEDCAEIICDLLIFETTVSVDTLAASMQRVGLRAEVLLPHANGEIGNQDVLRVYWRNRALTLHGPGLNLLTYELVRPDTWVSGVKEVLSMSNPPAEPVLVFTNEAKTWIHS